MSLSLYLAATLGANTVVLAQRRWVAQVGTLAVAPAAILLLAIGAARVRRQTAGAMDRGLGGLELARNQGPRAALGVSGRAGHDSCC